MSRQTRKATPLKIKRRIYRGVVYIQAGQHNTIVTITNIRGDVLCWSSAGACGFKGKRRATGFAAKKAAETAAKKGREFGMKEAKVLVIGPGQGRENAIREMFKAGLNFCKILIPTLGLGATLWFGQCCPLDFGFHFNQAYAMPTPIELLNQKKILSKLSCAC